MTKDEALRLALEALEKIAYVTAMDYEYQRWAREAIIAIKAALEAKDEPVAYLPPTASPENACYNPLQRTWVGLTDEEISDCMEMSIQKTCRAIEAKLKEKNT